MNRSYKTSPAFSVKVTNAALLSGILLAGSSILGCSTKNYVRSQTAPIVANVNDLDQKTAADHRAILDTDERATRGVNGALSAADAANQHALAAGMAADRANLAATGASNRVDSLSGVVANLDQYKQLSTISVTFASARDVLTPADKRALDNLAATLATTRGYILQVTGGTDSVGGADYNYRLSQRRADAVVNYLVAAHQIPPHKFYLVGIGKDVQVASDKTAAGRAKNRRVEVQLLSNMTAVGDSAGVPATAR